MKDTKLFLSNPDMRRATGGMSFFVERLGNDAYFLGVEYGEERGGGHFSCSISATLYRALLAERKRDLKKYHPKRIKKEPAKLGHLTMNPPEDYGR